MYQQCTEPSPTLFLLAHGRHVVGRRTPTAKFGGLGASERRSSTVACVGHASSPVTILPLGTLDSCMHSFPHQHSSWSHWK